MQKGSPGGGWGGEGFRVWERVGKKRQEAGSLNPLLSLDLNIKKTVQYEK
jgi:hypothetical protein